MQAEAFNGVPDLPQLNLTEEDLDKADSFIREEGIDSPRLAEWMGEMGISFDTGKVQIMLDGRLCSMDTRRDHFGEIAEKAEPLPEGTQTIRINPANMSEKTGEQITSSPGSQSPEVIVNGMLRIYKKHPPSRP